MFRNLILRSPDDDGAGGDPAADPATAGKPKQAPSASTTAKGGKTPREIALEKQVSTLEDEKAGLVNQVKEMSELVTAAKKAPGRNKGKTILDDLLEFTGFSNGQTEPEPKSKA